MNILSKALLGALFFRKLLKEAKKDRVTCDGFEEEASFYEKSWLEKDFLFSKFSILRRFLSLGKASL